LEDCARHRVLTICGSTTGSTASAVNHATDDAGLAVLPVVEPQIVSTLCLAQSSKKQATPLIKRTAEVLRKLSQQVI